MPGMRHKPPLTKSQLQEIQERRKGDEDVRALLWEIHRLRSIVLRADQLQRSLDSVGGGPGIVLQALRDELKGEPCVKEFPKLDSER
jgi:hypothetical protein